jgi:hypothetical protein
MLAQVANDDQQNSAGTYSCCSSPFFWWIVSDDDNNDARILESYESMTQTLATIALVWLVEAEKPPLGMRYS